MNRFFLLFFLFVFNSAFAQRPSFVYIQTEPAQPFVVVIGEKVYKSSQSGYLILSKLTDTAYSITINFPATQWPSQYFTLQLNHTDKGYLLKDFGDKGWGLMDWQKLTTQFSQQPALTKIPKTEIKSSDDDFASLLAKASGDPSLIASKPTEKKDTAVASVETKPIEKKEQPLTNTIPQTASSSVVTRRAESSTTEGFGLVYIDTYANGQSDTIRLIIPNKSEKVVIPSHCKELATEEQAAEFKKLLSIAGTEQKMMVTAKQLLSARCYTTAQIRILLTQFITDQSKYDFLLEAWSSLSDKENMLSLSTVFASKEIADRFKELLQ
jgi:type IV pilus biogenesis protein CpaD/CtpE